MRAPAVFALLSLALLSGCGAFSGGGGGGRLYQVRGHDLYLHCTGKGSPTVVLEAGLGDDSTMWDGILAQAGTIGTRVCAYDRLGLGQSDRTGKMRTLDEVARDLHGLVVAAEVERPFVLAAHSMGGLIDRAYAKRYPKDVAGLVLVDSVPDDWDHYVGYGFFAGAGEQLDIRDASASLRSSDTLGSKPVVVLRAAADTTVLSTLRAADPGRKWSDFQAYWTAAQRKLATISTNALYAVATRSDHDVPHARPALTAAAIRLAVESARTRRPLPTCARSGLRAQGASCR